MCWLFQTDIWLFFYGHFCTYTTYVWCTWKSYRHCNSRLSANKLRVLMRFVLFFFVVKMADSEHPLRRMKPLGQRKKPNPKFDREQARVSLCRYLKEIGSRNCRRIRGEGAQEAQVTKCTCLSFINDEETSPAEINAIADYMIHWKGLGSETKSEILKEHHRVSHAFKGKLCYVLPLLGNTGFSPRFICENALMKRTSSPKKNPFAQHDKRMI